MPLYVDSVSQRGDARESQSAGSHQLAHMSCRASTSRRTASC